MSLLLLVQSLVLKHVEALVGTEVQPVQFLIDASRMYCAARFVEPAVVL